MTQSNVSESVANLLDYTSDRDNRNVINVEDLYFFKQNLENILLERTVYVCKIQFLSLQLITFCSLQGHC